MEPLELVDSLGLCEHCGKLVSITDYAGDEGGNAKWICECGKPLTHLSFGYDKGTTGAKKIKWVGPNHKWTDTRPTDDFRLGNIQVIMKMPRYWY